MTCSKSLPSGGTSEGISGEGRGLTEFPVVAAQPCSVFSSCRVRKERAGGGGGVSALVCNVCVCVLGWWGECYTVVLFPSALILWSCAEGRGGGVNNVFGAAG